MLWVLKEALRRYYASDQIRTQGRSVRVSLSYVTTDIVPAIATGGLYDVLRIPDREVEKWKETHPRKHLELATSMNKRRGNLYKPLVKALKRWRDNRMENAWKPKSFLLGCLVYHHCQENSVDSIPRAIRDFLWFTYSRYDDHRRTKSCSPVVSDPAGIVTDVAAKWTYPDFCKFLDEVCRSWYVAYQALNSADYHDSVEKWRQLLGDDFPKST